jgi:hypothetical protein
MRFSAPKFSSKCASVRVPGIGTIFSLFASNQARATCEGVAFFAAAYSIVIQGKKRVDLGGTVFIYNASHYLLNSVDLPVLGQVIEATVDKPYLCMVLKLQMPVIRDLISRDDIASVKGFQEGKAMVTNLPY